MNRLLAALAIALLASSAHAASEDPAEKQKRDDAFAQMDTDKNGVIDRQEFDASLDAIASRVDTELEDGFKELDVNGDGKLDRDEAKPNAALVGYFDQIDVDKDGFLSIEEIRTALAGAKQADQSK